MAKEKSGKKEVKKGEQASYGAKDIYVLEGLDPVRKRPAMYIGSTGSDGQHHLIWECVDNAIDEAMGGYCKNIEISLLPQNRVKVIDDGRGIPVDTHAQTKKSALETVMTTLHAGAKFGSKAYQVSGGLHGVGVSVVCALSVFMRVEVCREGNRYYQEYVKGKPKTKVVKYDKCKKTGTTVIFEPDFEIFKEHKTKEAVTGEGEETVIEVSNKAADFIPIKFDSKKILNHLRQQAYLTQGVKMVFSDLRAKDPYIYSFYFEDGIRAYIRYLTRGDTVRHQNVFYTKGEKEGLIVEAAFQYTNERECYEESFANNIYTGEGGTHLTGFRSALTRTLNDYARKNNFLKGTDENLTGEDVREGLTAVVSVKIREPQFEGQTKARLGNTEARVAVDTVVAEAMTDFLERNPQDAKAMIESSILAQKARNAAKSARETVLRKGALEGLALPGKLADCTSRKPEESEIFIVEGESAGGSSRQARDRHFQAILPLRGKILNVEKARLDRILSSKEIRALIIAMGTGVAEDFDVERSRYHRIIIMCDADSDGNHIKTLLLTLFYRHFQPMIEKGYIYAAQPPLYKIQHGKRIEYAYNDEDKEEIVADIRKEQKVKKGKTEKAKDGEEEEKITGVNIQRYKGLGEMNPQELWDTTMNPENRVLLKINIESAREADKVFDVLMGEDVLPRKRFIQAHAKKVKNLDI
ncbi:MAG: DNA topoisomerase subunit B [Candidatus Parcubacteria bacterium]|nr:DNA topoisomerase subunit B [Candidatus Parcubacteria bacterium]